MTAVPEEKRKFSNSRRVRLRLSRDSVSLLKHVLSVLDNNPRLHREMRIHGRIGTLRKTLADIERDSRKHNAKLRKPEADVPAKGSRYVDATPGDDAQSGHASPVG